jgi:hypothetical protein
VDRRREWDDRQDRSDPQLAMNAYTLEKADVDSLVAYLVTVKKK